MPNFKEATEGTVHSGGWRGDGDCHNRGQRAQRKQKRFLELGEGFVQFFWRIGRVVIMRSVFELCDLIRETAFAIHAYHRHGHLEKVYENALAHRLRKLGLDVQQQHPIMVFDEDGTTIGEYYADLFVDNRLVVELKAAKALADEHIAQILGYLKSSRIEHGLLVNFGSFRFQIKKFILSDRNDAFE